MTDETSTSKDSLSPSMAERLDGVCGYFEAAWNRAQATGPAPRIEDYLGDTPEPDRRALLRELLALELQYRLRNGESPTLEEYRQRFPNESELVDAVYRQTSGTIGTRPLDVIGKYRIVEKLGGGGQADVFRAVHPVLRGRDVVIKLARQRLSEAYQQQLLQEGQTLARLEDVGMARVYDVDVYETRPFIVMEHIAGGTLRDQLRERRPAPREAAALVAQLARTLARVHGQGVLHRDLKPANILLDAAGRPRIVDFGLALMAQPWAEARPPEGEVSGTFQYMAPEQAEGQSQRIGPRTDVFGLGAVFYEMLTGRPPYQAATTREVWEQARQAKVVPSRTVNARVPRALERICLKALAADPDDRYATAAEMERALRGYLRRPRILVAGLGLTALILAAVLAVAFGPWHGSVEPGALSGELVLRVWGDGKRGLRVGEDPAALPVRNGEMVHLEARLNQPAYVYLLWVDSQGSVESLYPWQDRHFRNLPVPQVPVEQLDNPPELDMGWMIVGQSGLETALLLVRRSPLPADVDLMKEIGKLKPSPFRHPQEVAVRGFDPGQPTAFVDIGQNRGLAADAAEIDEPLLASLERLRRHFETIRAVRFAHQGD